jgi:hypothetical protein
MPDTPLFAAQASDPDAVIWHLRLDQAGRATLLYNDDEVAALSPAQAAAFLRAPDNPTERAEDLMAALTSNLAVVMHDHARISLESDLSRWIAQRY